MQTRQNLEDELSARIMIANNSTLFGADRITQVIKDAYLWAGSLFFWPALYRSRIFSTTPNTQSLKYDYYDYPVDMLQNSINRLYIGGKEYQKKAFNDFLDYVDNTLDNSIPPDPTKRYFAEFGRQFFVYPTVTSPGTNDCLIWGNIQPPPLNNPTDNTIFSLWDDSGNEAILQKAMAVLMARLDSGFAMGQEQSAIQLLTLLWGKVVKELQKNQRLNHPRFQVIDMFGAQSGESTISNFNSVDVLF